MLFNRSAVRKPIPIKKGLEKIVRNSPFLGKKDFHRFLRTHLSKKDSDLETAFHTVRWIARYVKYDDRHTYEGFRTPVEVLLHQKGHCVEQNVLLFNALTALGVRTKPILVKNPKGFKSNLKELAFHLFLKFQEGETTYLADQVSEGVYIFDKTFYYTAIQKLSRRELNAFCFGDGAEDFLVHGKPEKAIEYVRAALTLDPNNYTYYLTATEARMEQGDKKRAYLNFREAIKIAPDLADPYKTYADLLWRFYDTEGARKYYLKASTRDSKDSQVLQSLQSRLRYLHETEAAKKVGKKLEVLEQSRPAKDLYMVLLRLTNGGWIRRIYNQ